MKDEKGKKGRPEEEPARTGDAEPREAYERLEELVEERTAELLKATELLKLEVAERMRVEGELRVSQERFSKAFHSSPCLMAITTIEDGRLIDLNEGFTRLTGYSREEALGRTCDEMGVTETETREPIIAMAKEEGSIHNVEVPFRTKSGEPRVGSLSAQILKLDDEPCLLTVMEDVTEHRSPQDALRRSEERYRAVVEDQTELICRFLPDMTLTFVNGAYCRHFHRDPEELIGTSFMPFFPEEDRGKVREHVASLSQERPVTTQEHRMISPAGETRWHRWAIRAIFDQEGRAGEFQAVGRDITVQKYLEEQLLHAHKMQAVGTLAGGIAHEFNNILQGILGYADLLMLSRDEKDPDIGSLRNIILAAKRGRELTQKMLAFSRGMEGRPRPLDTGFEIKRFGKLLATALPPDIEIRLDISPDLSPVNADPGQLEQVFMNLAFNAKDAMDQGGQIVIAAKNVTLEEELAGVRAEDAPRGWVLISFSDTGHGMDQETLARAFEPFFSSRETGKGTGLGLAVVHGIVESHGGRIEAVSEPGEGATFNIYLPALKFESEEIYEKPDPDSVRGEETILLVDDEEVVAEVGRRMLTRFGYSVITAPDGETALAIFREKMGQIDMVILDLVMPGMGGERCLKELLELDPRVKVLVASGQHARGSVDAYLDAGARGFIGKPYEFSVILRRVREILDAD